MILWALAHWAAPLAQADGKTVKVGVYANAPKIFISESGRPAGIFIDVIESIAKSEGWSIRYVPGTWAEGLDRLAKGEIDLMPDVALSPERENQYAFHKVPVLSSWFQVYAPRGSKIKSLLDLNGQKILVMDRSVQQESFVRLSKGFGLNFTLVSVPDYKTMFEMLSRREADAAVTNRFYGLMQAKKLGLVDTGVIFEPSDLFFAASRKDPKFLLAAIDRHLLEMKKDPQSAYYRSLKRWISESVPFRPPAWLQVLGLVVGLVLLSSLAGSFVLKHQVNARTKELRQINREMERRIMERTSELAVAMEKAQSADRIKSAFLATMSHELRTPLNSIIGFTGILLQGLGGPLSEEQEKQLGMVQKSGRHLLNLINDVLDISKIEAGELSIAREPFDLSAIILSAVAAMRPIAEKGGVRIEAALPEGPLNIVADRRRTEQVLTNLLSNAVKFTPGGGEVRVSAERVPPEARAGAGEASPGGIVRVGVADTGIGIRPEDMETIFEAFRQVDCGMTRQFEGTGLGLSISRRLVSMMGGEIRAESAGPGAGSRFTFTLPGEEPPEP